MLERFWERVDKRGPDECWLWTGASRNGYGTFAVDGVTKKAHRVSWEIANGKPFPSELHGCHRCDVKLCVNPAHVFPGTRFDNMRDAHEKGIVKTPYKMKEEIEKLRRRVTNLERALAYAKRITKGETQLAEIERLERGE